MIGKGESPLREQHKLIEIGAFFHVSLDWLILGKNGPEVVRESSANYALEVQPQSDLTIELLPEEKEFIKEYIAFVEHRKQSASLLLNKLHL